MKQVIISRNKKQLNDFTSNGNNQKDYDKLSPFKSYITMNQLHNNKSSLSFQSNIFNSQIVTSNNKSKKDLTALQTQSIQSYSHKTYQKTPKKTILKSHNEYSSIKEQKQYSLINKSIESNFKTIEIEGHTCLLGNKSNLQFAKLFLGYKKSNNKLKKSVKYCSLPLIIEQLKHHKKQCKIKEEMSFNIFNQRNKNESTKNNLVDLFSNSQISKAIMLDKRQLNIEPSSNIYVIKSK